MDDNSNRVKTEEDKNSDFKDTKYYNQPFVMSELVRNKTMDLKHHYGNNDNVSSPQGHKNLRANFARPEIKQTVLVSSQKKQIMKMNKEDSEDSVKFYLPSSYKQSP